MTPPDPPDPLHILVPELAISQTSFEAISRALADLLAESCDRLAPGLAAPDVALEFCAQYVINTRRECGDRWDTDHLVQEYLRQMTSEQWKTVRHVAARPLKRSSTTGAMYLSLVTVALRRAGGARPGRLRSAFMTLGAYGRGLLRVGNASAPPFPGRLPHRDLRRRRLAVDEAWAGRMMRETLARHVLADGLSLAPCMRDAWRQGLLALALARRGAAALARSRGEREIDRACLEDALRLVEERLLANGELWRALRHSPLVEDITDRFMSRKVAVGTLIGEL